MIDLITDLVTTIRLILALPGRRGTADPESDRETLREFLARSKEEDYLGRLKRLFLAAVVLPVLLLGIGILAGWPWLVALTGLWIASATYLALLVFSPLGIVIEILVHGPRGSGSRYVKLISSVLIAELCTALFASIIPLHNNLAMLPLLLVASIALGLLNSWLFQPAVVRPVVSVIMLLLVLSFYFPSTFSALGERLEALDDSIRPPRLVSYEAIAQREVKAFRSNGSPNLWYFRSRDGRYELYDAPGHHPVYNGALEPITAVVLAHIEEQAAREEQRRRDAEAEEARTKAITDRETFLTRYLASRPPRDAATCVLAVVAVDPNNHMDASVAREMAEILGKTGAKALPTIFRTEFVTDGLFDSLFDGRLGDAQRLNLVEYADYAVLARRRVEFVKNGAGDNLTTAQATMEVHTISPRTGQSLETFSVSANGAGFSAEAADQMAAGRLMRTLEHREWHPCSQ